MKNKVLRLIIRHNIINFIGFSVVAILNIALIPIIIKNFGLENFGLLSIIRYMLPIGILGLLDFGIPETITRYVAHGRGESSEDSVRSIVSFGLLSMTIIGISVALLFYIVMVNMPLVSDRQGYIISVIPITTLTILIMFSGIAVESIIKGMEKFSLIRICEILRTILYFIVVLLIVYNNVEFIYVIYAMLFTYWLQHLIYIIVFLKNKSYLKPERKYIRRDFEKYTSYAMIVFKGKIISNIMTNLPPFIIAPVGGLKSVGIYEAITKLPKYTKTVLSIINASVMPISARLRGAGDIDSEKSLLLNGTALSSFIFLPILICIIALSDTIISMWLGEGMRQYALWFGVAFFLPFMTNYLTVGMSMLVVHKNELKKINRIATLQLTIFSIVGVVFIKLIPESSFILGIVMAQIIALPIQIRVISSFYKISIWEVVKPLVWVIISSIIPLIILFVVKDNITGLTGLIMYFGFYTLIQWLLIFSTYFDRIQRKQVFQLITRRT